MSAELLTKCSRCEGDIIFPAGIDLIKCPWCDRPNSRPKSQQDDEIRLMKYANERRNLGEFDEAERAYRRILQSYDDEHEARWGLLLCKYGIMYVERDNGRERIITCRRGRNSAFLSEPDYQMVLSQAPAQVRAAYEQDGEYINRVQAEIRRLRRTMDPYQVFICYKETGEHGERTEDSVLAQGIYNALTRRNYRTFYAPVSLKNLAGANYEAAIFCAIESSSVMLALGTKKEYLESTWVRSEWSRFLELSDKDETRDRLLIPLYRDLAPGKDLPQEFRDRYLEALDIRNPGYMFDIEDIISKVMKVPDASEAEKQDNRLTLVRMFLQVGNFQEAEPRLDELLREQPQNLEVWLLKAMLDEKIKNEEDFLSLSHPLQENFHFQTALTLAQGERRAVLEQYRKKVDERLKKEEEARIAAEKARQAEAARIAAERARQEKIERLKKKIKKILTILLSCLLLSGIGFFVLQHFTELPTPSQTPTPTLNSKSFTPPPTDTPTSTPTPKSFTPPPTDTPPPTPTPTPTPKSGDWPQNPYKNAASASMEGANDAKKHGKGQTYNLYLGPGDEYARHPVQIIKHDSFSYNKNTGYFWPYHKEVGSDDDFWVYGEFTLYNGTKIRAYIHTDAVRSSRSLDSIRLDSYDAYLFDDSFAYCGPGTNYDKVQSQKISEGTSLDVFYSEKDQSGTNWVFAEFYCNLGKVRAWLPEKYVSAQ